MTKILWNALKLSPAILGASLVIASSSQAAQTIPEVTPNATEPATVETIPQVAAVPTIVAPETAVEPVAATEATNPQVAAAPTIVAPETAVEPVAATEATNPLPNLAPSTPVAQMPAMDNNSEILNQVESYSNDDTSIQDQVTNVSQLRDVSPGDWAYEALRSLVERYGCIVGYPDGTFRGNRATSRYEFAAGLNACLQQIERLIAASTADFATKEDLETLRRLVEEFRAELTALGTRVDALEGRVTFLEDNQFSTTTKLVGQVIFALSNAYGEERADGGGDLDSNVILTDRVRLQLNTSFSGRDTLYTRLQAANNTGLAGVTGTTETLLAFPQDNGNDVRLDTLKYFTPIGDRGTLFAGARGLAADDILDPISDFISSSGEGALSNFGGESSIYFPYSGAGLGFSYNLSDAFQIAAGYIGNSDGSVNNPGEDTGLFNGTYGAMGQLTIKPSDAIKIGLTYIHGYFSPGVADPNIADVFIGGPDITGTTGTARAIAPFGANTATSTNNFGIQAQFKLSSRFVIGGWGGYTQAIAESGPGAINRGSKADIWFYAVNFIFPDFGKEGNQLYVTLGVPPYVAGNDVRAGRNPDIGYHAEVGYRYQVTENISITPGAFVLFNPEANDDNDNIYVGVVRTTFSF